MEQFPQQIADHIRVTKSPMTLRLVALTVLFLAIVFWFFLGSITDKGYMTGVIFPSGSTEGVNVPYAGTVITQNLQAGQSVQAGQVLAMVSINGQYSAITAPCDGFIFFSMPVNSSFEPFDNIVTIIRSGNNEVDQELICFVDFKTKRDLKPGMPVQVTPSDETRERVGYVIGSILSISDYPVAKEEAIDALDNRQLIEDLFPESGSAYLVRVKLEKDPDSWDGLKWSFKANEMAEMSIGTFCDAMVIVKDRSVYGYLMENVSEAKNKVRLMNKK